MGEWILQLEVGDIVTIQNPNGEVVDFTVSNVKVVPNANRSDMIFEGVEGTASNEIKKPVEVQYKLWTTDPNYEPEGKRVITLTYR